MKSLGKLSAFCVLALPFVTAPAHAVMTVDSSAYALSASLSAVNAVLVDIGPLAAAGGTAAPAYNDSAALATIDQQLQFAGLGLVSINQRLNTGVVTSSASSPYPVTPTGTATSAIAGVDIGLETQVLFLPPLTILGLTADAITSTTSVSAVGGLSATGATTIAGLDLTGLGLGGLFIDAALFVNPDPNTVLLDLLGLRIVLNEQTSWGDGVNSIGLATNALRITFDDFLLGGRLVSGDVILGHSQASITDFVQQNAVPEPASWALMIMGFGLVGSAMRIRKARPAMA